MSFDISASGLEAQRIRLDVLANNIANAQTTRTADGGPYKRRGVIFEAVGGTKGAFFRLLDKARREEALGQGVKVAKIIEQQGDDAFIEVYDPTHPDADEKGIVRLPNIQVSNEIVNLIDAQRAYEANVTAMNSTKQIAAKTLEIGRT